MCFFVWSQSIFSLVEKTIIALNENHLFQLYKMYGRTDPSSMSAILHTYNSSYIILEDSICLAPTNNNCRLPDIVDGENGEVRDIQVEETPWFTILIGNGKSCNNKYGDTKYKILGTITNFLFWNYANVYIAWKISLHIPGNVCSLLVNFYVHNIMCLKHLCFEILC